MYGQVAPHIILSARRDSILGASVQAGGSRRYEVTGAMLVASAAMRCNDDGTSAPRSVSPRKKLGMSARRWKPGSMRKGSTRHLLVGVFVLLYIFSSADATLAMAVPFDAASLAMQAASWMLGDGGLMGTFPFVALHILCIVVCFPGTAAFELAAGAVFGLLPGIAAVATAKGLAACITFGVAQMVGQGALGRWALDRLQDSGGQEWTARLQQGVRQDAFRFCFLARLSPVPSWVNNYALPLAGVPFSTFLTATLLGMLLPLASNVYSGTAAASLAVALSGGGNGSSAVDWIGLLLGIVSALSGAAVVQQLASFALRNEGE